MNDNELHSLIRQTQPKPEFPASFQREVWVRIAVAEQQSWSAFWQQLFPWFARPVPALATMTLMLGFGIGLGSLTTPPRDESIRLAYAASINPVQAAHAAIQP